MNKLRSNLRIENNMAKRGAKGDLSYIEKPEDEKA